MNNTLFVATDGGVAKTSDGGQTWSKWYKQNNDLCISELFRLGADPSGETIVGGLQDNGLFRYVAGESPTWLSLTISDVCESIAVSKDELYTTDFINSAVISKVYRNTNDPYYSSETFFSVNEDDFLAFGGYEIDFLKLPNQNTFYTGRVNLWKKNRN